MGAYMAENLILNPLGAISLAFFSQFGSSSPPFPTWKVALALVRRESAVSTPADRLMLMPRPFARMLLATWEKIQLSELVIIMSCFESYHIANLVKKNYLFLFTRREGLPFAVPTWRASCRRCSLR